MSYYLVKAKPKDSLLDELEKKLSDKAFKELEPFGKALSKSLEEARKTEEGLAVWEEEDHCDPPLKEERKAVLDKYFDDLQFAQIKEGEGWKEIKELPKLFPDL